MRLLTETDAKKLAREKATAKGHVLGPWRRAAAAHHRNRSPCRVCGAELLVISEILDRRAAESMAQDGVIIGGFVGGLPDVDYTYATGSALVRSCR